MIRNIRYATIYVSDQDRALEFYVSRLGFRKQMDQTFENGFRWLTVVPQDEQTGYVLLKPMPGSAEADLVGRIGGSVIAADDIQATYHEMVARGVQFSEPPTRQPWGMQALFADPDGNGFVLVEA